MNLQKLRERHAELIGHMVESGYSKKYISAIRSEITRILNYAPEKSWNSYKDVYIWHTENCQSKSYLHLKRCVIGLLEQFDLYGRYPNGLYGSTMFPQNSHHKLSVEFKALIDFYQDVESRRGLKSESIRVMSSGAAAFLYFMQIKGADTLEKITEDTILSYFMSEDGKVLRGSSPRNAIEVVFTRGIAWNEAKCRRMLSLLSYLPKIHQSRKNIQYLSKREAEKIRTVVKDITNGLSLRNRAIIVILMHTGLRRGDIACMMLDSIDWENDIIHVIQQKTSRPLELPLSAIVGNAIFDYIRFERPNTTDNHLFIREKRPFTSLSSNGIYTIVGKVLDASGIRQESGAYRGAHVFRHRAVTTMLENKIQQPVISQILGHTSPRSLEPYLHADFVHLKDCSLDISCFPVAEEVFCFV